MLLSQHPFIGNLRVYDITKTVNIHRLKPDFETLTTDKYVPEGFRKKHIQRLHRLNERYQKIPHQPLYQSSQVNPTHGNINRVYPEYIAHDQNEILKLVDFFIQKNPIPDNASFLVQAQRIICNNDLVGHPSVEGWHRDGVAFIGIACIDRQNIKGGISEFLDNKTGKIEQLLLQPGQIVIFNDTEVKHRVTPITTKEKNEGHRDVILMSYPDCTTH